MKGQWFVSMMLTALAAGWLLIQPGTTAGESAGQLRVAYGEMSRLQALTTTGLTHAGYREAVANSREAVAQLGDLSDQSVRLLRSAQAYHDQALAVWKMQTDSDFPVDSLRSDEADGAAIIGQCPGVPRFNYKWRDQVYVRDAVACLWGKAAELLGAIPDSLR